MDMLLRFQLITLCLNSPLIGLCSNSCPTDWQTKAPVRQCGTCNGRCDLTISAIDRPSCACDPLCVLHGDCCRDVFDFCPAVAHPSQNRHRYVNVTDVTCQRVGSSGNGGGEQTGYVSMVTGCSGGDPAACSTMASFYQRIPVTDRVTGLHFVNPRCARCHGVNEAEAWAVRLRCNAQAFNDLGVAIDNTTNDVNGGSGGEAVTELEGVEVTYSLVDALATHPSCTYDTYPRGDQPVRSCVPWVVRTCPAECRNVVSMLVDLCENGALDLVTDGVLTYKNGHCALCHSALPPLHCGFQQPVMGASGRYGKFSLSILLDFTLSDDDALRLHQPDCRPGFVRVGDECLVIECPNRYHHLVNNSCVPMPKTEYVVDFECLVLLYSSTANKTTMLEIIESRLTVNQITAEASKRLRALFNDSDPDNVNMKLNYTMLSVVSFRASGLISFVVYNLKPVNNNTRKSDSEILQMIRKILSASFRIRGLNVSQLVVDLDSLDSTPVQHDMSVSCQHVKLNSSLYIVHNDSVEVLRTGQRIPLANVILTDDHVYLCVDDLQNIPDFSIASSLGITTIVVLSLSLLCLSVRIVLHVCLPCFATSPMRLQLGLCVTLFLAYLAFLLGPLAGENTQPCRILAIIIHWTFIASFFWMLVIAVDMWWLFRPSGTFVKIHDGHGFFWRYCIVALLSPSLIVSSSIATDHSDATATFQPQYGRALCFINGPLAMVIFFVVPIACVVALNSILFVVTSFNLHRALSSNRRFTGNNWRRELNLYARFFTLMGITWLFGVLAPLVNSYDALWYLFVVGSGLQGVYIFVAFVCTRKVMIELRAKYFGNSVGGSGTSSEILTLSRSSSSVIKRRRMRSSNNAYSNRPRKSRDVEEEDNNAKCKSIVESACMEGQPMLVDKNGSSV